MTKAKRRERMTKRGNKCASNHHPTHLNQRDPKGTRKTESDGREKGEKNAKIIQIYNWSTEIPCRAAAARNRAPELITSAGAKWAARLRASVDLPVSYKVNNNRKKKSKDKKASRTEKRRRRTPTTATEGEWAKGKVRDEAIHEPDLLLHLRSISKSHKERGTSCISEWDFSLSSAPSGRVSSNARQQTQWVWESHRAEALRMTVRVRQGSPTSDFYSFSCLDVVACLSNLFKLQVNSDRWRRSCSLPLSFRVLQEQKNPGQDDKPKTKKTEKKKQTWSPETVITGRWVNARDKDCPRRRSNLWHITG